MADVKQQLCDGCGALLSGKQGIATVRKPALEINGQMVYELVDKQTNWRDHVFLTRTREERLAFCVGDDEENPKMDCFVLYITYKLRKQKEWKERKLREEAGEEWNDRNVSQRPPSLIRNKRVYYGGANEED